MPYAQNPVEVSQSLPSSGLQQDPGFATIGAGNFSLTGVLAAQLNGGADLNDGSGIVFIKGPASPAISTSQQPATATWAPRSPTRPRSAAGTTRPGRSPSTSTTTPPAPARRCSPTPRRSRGGTATSAGYTATATGTDYWVATYNGDSNNSAGHQRHGLRAGDHHPGHARRSAPASSRPRATVGTSIADQATVSGGYNPTGTVTFNLYNNSTAHRHARCSPTPRPLVGGTATSAGYTATATGTDYWVATYNGDSNNSAGHQRHATSEPVTITPATPGDQHQPAAGQRDGRHLDRRQGHGQRRLQPDRHRHLQPLQQLQRHRHARCSPTPRTLVGGMATSAGYTPRPPAPTTGSPPTTATATTARSPAARPPSR